MQLYYVYNAVSLLDAPKDSFIDGVIIERQKCYGQDKKILFKKQLFDLKVKGQGPTKVIMVRDTPPYGYAPTYLH
jgi:hypothetical protein